MKIEAMNTEQGSRMFGRHFDHTDQLVSKISRESINALKAFFTDQMSKEDWRLVSVSRAMTRKYSQQNKAKLTDRGRGHAGKVGRVCLRGGGARDKRGGWRLGHYGVRVLLH
jgi:hypothetical protein